MERAAVFVGMTTLPSRIDKLRPTLDSLRAQTLPPDRIIVCLPRRSVREGSAYAVPAWLDPPPPGVQLVHCERDYGPGTKLLGCLPHVPTDACLIVVDDDMVYKPFLVERLYRAQVARRDASFSFHVWRIGRFRCGQGADGFSFWTRNLGGIEAFAASALKSRHLFLVDDYWISVFLRTRGVPVLGLAHTLEDGEFAWEHAHTDNQLSHLAGGFQRSAVLRKATWFLFSQDVLEPRWRLMCLLTYVEGSFRSLWLRMPSVAWQRRNG